MKALYEALWAATAVLALLAAAKVAMRLAGNMPVDVVTEDAGQVVYEAPRD